MQPVEGMGVYQKMREANAWVEEYLPNASGAPESRLVRSAERARPYRRLSKGAEYLFQTPPGDWLESWEMNRKIRKLSGLGMGDEAAFSAQWCKGHFENHGRYALDKFDDQWCKIEGQQPSGKVE
jgi:hypothetical protein